MREIKFIAWDGKYMVNSAYGDWVSFDGVPYTEASKKYNTPNVEVEVAKEYILMQWTGLLDKNGKEIYSGDIIRRLGAIYKVDFIEGSFCLNSYPLSGLYKNSEIIGNIYENPELLNP